MLLTAFAGAGTLLLMGGTAAADTGEVTARPTAAPAAPARINLSSRQAINRYLRSIGVNPRSVVVQRGLRNYAGPNCPGPRWNCTKARKVVQISRAGGVNRAKCTAKPGRRCVIVQAASRRGFGALRSLSGTPFLALNGWPVNMSASCNQRLFDSGTLTPCSITQTNNTGGNNTANVAMSVQDTTGSTQSGVGDASVTQSAVGAGNNSATVNQVITLRSTATGTTQTQDGQLSAIVNQTSVNGTNTSTINQRISEQATASGTSITQLQNTAEPADNCSGSLTKPTANICAKVDQDSATNKDSSTLDQTIDLTATANAPSGSGVTQTQGHSGGGVEGFVTQDSPVPKLSDADQRETQKLTAPAGSTQSQTIDPRCCATQTGGSGSQAFITQQGTQSALSTAAQSSSNTVTCDSDGTCNTSSTLTQNDGTDIETCTGSVCGYVQTCPAGLGEPCETTQL